MMRALIAAAVFWIVADVILLGMAAAQNPFTCPSGYVIVSDQRFGPWCAPGRR